MPSLLATIAVSDYCEGPVADDHGRSEEWWVFGPVVEGVALYVKVAVTAAGEVVCLSLHTAQYPMVRPFGGSERR